MFVVVIGLPFVDWTAARENIELLLAQPVVLRVQEEVQKLALLEDQKDLVEVMLPVQLVDLLVQEASWKTAHLELQKPLS